MVRIRLLRPHTHKGIDYQAGDLIEVRPDQAERLIGLSIAEKAETEEKKLSKKSRGGGKRKGG